MMCVRSDQSETLASGHAMMMSFPPSYNIVEQTYVIYPHKAPDLPAALWMKLYYTSLPLPDLGGEITPIQALQIIRGHPRYRELVPGDFEFLRKGLEGKSRCYG